MTKTKQKFKHGDLVRVADDLGPSMDHFQKGCNAIVIGSYADQFGGGNRTSYTIFVEGGGETSWYEEWQLTFVRHAPELLETWKDQQEARTRDHADPKWIMAHWPEVRKNPSSTTILTLFHLLDFHSSFERNGEYYCLYVDYEAAFPVLDYLLTHTRKEVLKSLTPDSPEAATVAKFMDAIGVNKEAA